MDDLEWLEQWYASQCDGDWEHESGVTLDTLDNPGWWLKIPLAGTDLASRSADALVLSAGDAPEVLTRHPDGSPARVTHGGADWIVCRVERGAFEGAGDPHKLRAILRCFREWATKVQ